jgi:sulfur dioxygenase
MILRQLFDQDTWTYTYLLADEVSREAVIIDPVIEKVERDLKLISELGLKLIYTLDTHVHADHVTGSGTLRERTGALSVVSAVAKVKCADQNVQHGDRIRFGAYELEVRSTPGHTDGCVTYVLHREDETLAFTGDALFIRGCGRTDFQQGSSPDLYHSVHSQIFSLAPNTVIYPGHDYRGHSSSTVAEEKVHNPRLNVGIGKDEFIEIMENLNLANPRLIDVAVPANQTCGVVQATPTVANEIQEVTPENLNDVTQYRVMDVRQPEEFNDELGHIEGAELIPLSTVPSAVGAWSKEEPILVVCRRGGRGVSACEVLNEMGFKQVTNLVGGMEAWRAMHQDTSIGSRS